MKAINIKFHKIHPNAKVPEYAHYDDSGADTFLVEDLTIPARGVGFSSLGYSVETPEGLEFQFRSKSGLAKKQGIFVLNSPGTIDAGYRDEVGVIIGNFSDKDVTLEAGTKIGQLVLCPVYRADFRSENRGMNGFGSTGLTSKAAPVPEITLVPVNDPLNINNYENVSQIVGGSTRQTARVIPDNDRPYLTIS